MKTKSLAILLVLAMLILAAGTTYSAKTPKGGTFVPPVNANPWEELKNNDGPSGCSANAGSDDQKVIAIPIFSDFLILIYIKNINKENSDSEKSVEFKGKSYQIIFSR